MTIFLAFLQSPHQYPIAAYSFWEYFIKNGINEAKCNWIECEEVDWARGLIPQSKDQLEEWKNFSWEKTLKYIKKNKPDLFLSYLYPQQVDVQAISEIKKMGIPCVNFFCDNIRMFKQAPKEYAIFDLNWVPEYMATTLYQNAKYPYINLPMPMWVDYQYRAQPGTEKKEISFIGSKDLQRHLFFEKLVKEYPNLDLNICGTGWLEENANINKEVRNSTWRKMKNQFYFISRFGIKPYLNKIKDSRVNPVLSNELKSRLKAKPDFNNYIKITRESLITLGINRYPSFDYPINRPNTYSRLRDIEATMYGACYLTELAPGLDQIYEIGKDIEVFSNPAELYEKIKELEKDARKRKMLRINGQEKALHTLSIPNSITKINAYFK